MIAIRIPNWLGDAVLARRAITTICRANEEQGVVLAGKPHLLGLLQSDFPRAQLIETTSGLTAARRLASQLRHRGVTRYWILPSSLSSRLGGLWSGAGERIGFGPRPSGRRERESGLFLTRRVTRGAIGSRHLEDEYLDLTACPIENWADRSLLKLSDETIQRATELLPGEFERGFVAVAPGARYGPAKRWPVESFSETIRLLANSQPDLAIVIVGEEADREACAALSRSLSGTVCSIVGKTDLPQFAGVLSQASAVLSNDSGTAHLAAALGRPTVVLFGSTEPAWTAPRGPRVVVHHDRLRCSPCFQRKCHWKDSYGCLRVIEPRQVFESFEEVLGRVAA